MKVKSDSEVAQSCLTLRDLMDCSLLGSSVHGIFQARVLEWGAIARQQKRHRYIEQSYGLCGREQGWDDLGNGIEKCIVYVKLNTSPGSMHDTGYLGLLPWDDPEGGYGEVWGGR